MYALTAAAGRGVFENEGNTSTFVHLTAEKLRAHRFPWPAVPEQADIVRTLDQEKATADTARASLRKQIGLLQDRRQALLTAAVTGQIEIPGMAA
jgi:type I restriction enzyme S subunit